MAAFVSQQRIYYIKKESVCQWKTQKNLRNFQIALKLKGEEMLALRVEYRAVFGGLFVFLGKENQNIVEHL